MKNICFVGRMRSGKTTLSEALVKEWGYRRLSFAEPVKYASCRVYNLMQQATDVGNMPLQSITTEDLARDKDKYRKLMQLVGTELGRELFGEDVWVNKLIQKIEYSTKPIVVDDVRFRNELASLVNIDFYPIYLTRSEEVSKHPSEMFTEEHFKKFMDTAGKKEFEDYYILDNETLEEYTSIQAVLRIAQTFVKL